MCGVIGIISKDGSKIDSAAVEALLVESQIRGKHATGLAWTTEDGEVHAESAPLAAKDFCKTFDFSKLANAVAVIGHTRYSTSDLSYNQPIYTEGISATVHNGVVTQADKSEWLSACITKNDSEILHNCFNEGKDILDLYPEASVSALHLNRDSITVMNNKRRPLHKYEDEHVIIYASTADIAKRALNIETSSLWDTGELKLEKLNVR